MLDYDAWLLSGCDDSDGEKACARRRNMSFDVTFSLTNSGISYSGNIKQVDEILNGFSDIIDTFNDTDETISGTLTYKDSVGIWHQYTGGEFKDVIDMLKEKISSSKDEEVREILNKGDEFVWACFTKGVYSGQEVNHDWSESDVAWIPEAGYKDIAQLKKELNKMIGCFIIDQEDPEYFKYVDFDEISQTEFDNIMKKGKILDHVDIRSYEYYVKEDDIDSRDYYGYPE